MVIADSTGRAYFEKVSKMDMGSLASEFEAFKLSGMAGVSKKKAKDRVSGFRTELRNLLRSNLRTFHHLIQLSGLQSNLSYR